MSLIHVDNNQSRQNHQSHHNYKGCVYAFYKPEYKILYSNIKKLKIGHTKNLENRFRSYNTYCCDEKEYIENNIDFYLHSEKMAFSGTRIMERIIHEFFKDKQSFKEFFDFPLDFNIENHFEELKEIFENDNINDLKIYKSEADIPLTIMPLEITKELKKDFDNEENEDSYDLENYENKRFKPKEYQIDIINKCVKYFESENKGGLYLSPGVGKTYIATFVMREMKMKRILVLTHRLEICSEWEKCFDLAGMKYVIVNSESPFKSSSINNILKTRIIISTYQTCHKKIKDFGVEFDFVIYDEAHAMIQGDEKNKCRNTLKLSGKKLFLTATPKIKLFKDVCEEINEVGEKKTESDDEKIEREDDDYDVDSEDSEMENESKEEPHEMKEQRIHGLNELNEKEFGKPIVQMSLHEAINKGYLTDYKFVLHDQPKTDCVGHISVLINKFQMKKILVFYNSVKEAEEAYEILKKNFNFSVFYMDGGTRKEERRNIIERFETEEIAVIVNIRVLSEGFSACCVDTILIMDTIQSSTTIVQVLGRALRKYKGKECSILCIPTECYRTFENALTSLEFDRMKSEGNESMKNKILFSGLNKERKELFLKKFGKTVNMVEMSCSGKDLFKMKLKMIDEYAKGKEYKELPSIKYKKNDIGIGVLCNTIKHSFINKTKSIYTDFLNEPEFKDLKSLFISCVENRKLKPKLTKEQQREKLRIIDKYAKKKEYKELPSQKYGKGIGIGMLCNNIKRLFVNKTESIYIVLLNEPEFKDLKSLFGSCVENRKIQPTKEQKRKNLILIDEYAKGKKYKKLPPLKYKKNGIGILCNSIKRLFVKKTESIYIDFLNEPEFKDLKSLFISCVENRKLKLTKEQKRENLMLIDEYAKEKEYKELPPKKYKKNGIGIGMLCSDIKKMLKKIEQNPNKTIRSDYIKFLQTPEFQPLIRLFKDSL